MKVTLQNLDYATSEDLFFNNDFEDFAKRNETMKIKRKWYPFQLLIHRKIKKSENN